MKLKEHDQNILNHCSDAIVYSESIDDDPIGSKLSDYDEWCGQYEWREQCAMMAMDFNELVHAKKEHFVDDWHDFVECAKRYFEEMEGRFAEFIANDGTLHPVDCLDVWDWFLCPTIIGRALERWKKENNHDLYAIRKYHVEILQEILKA